MSTTIQFNRNLTQTDPVQQPVLIVGQLRHLRLITFENVKCKLEPRVSAETFEEAINKVRSSVTDICPLHLDVATIAALPSKCSRYNTTSRAHFLTRLINSQTKGVTESIVIACDVNDLFASACAIVRAYPLFNRKLNQRGKEMATIHIEFIVFENNAISEYELTDSDVKCLTNVATGIRLTAKIVDMPCSEMNVSLFLEQIQLVSNELAGTKVETIRGQELRDRGFGGIYGVGKAANDPPALAILSYEPMGATENIVWVGKGIVYDTGGLSIKGKTSMPGMKRDCGGAAAILGAFYATVKGGFQQNLYAVFCLAENSVGPNATRPDDIHVMYSGRTVEINNTDAEGRLVLADGVAYAYKDLKANIILDMATLTGAQGIATGKYHAAVLTNNEDWETKCVQAGKITGDLVAPIVYAPELHFVEFSSSMADMKNSVNDRNNAQSSCAGLFIESHIGAGFDGAWVHIDMAAPVHAGERATGYGVALLCSLFGSETNCTLLQSISPSSNKTVLL